MSNSKFVAGLILGAAAGTFIALFANSDKGQDFLDDVKDKAGDWKDKAGDWKDTAKGKYSDVGDEISDLISKGKKFISQLEKKAKDVKDAATA